MKKQIEQARKAGYSDEEIASFLSEKNPKVSEALQSGYEPSEVLSFLEKQKKSNFFGKEGTLIGGKVGSAIGGAIEKPGLITEELPLAGLKALEGFTSMFNPSNIYEKRPQASELLEEHLHKDLSPELRESAQDISDIESLFMVGGAGRGIKPPKQIKGPKVSHPKKPDAVQKMYEERKAFEGIQPSGESAMIEEAFESGLPKPRAVTAEKPEWGIISKERQKEAIGGLEKEAQKLIEKKVEKHLPISEKFREGFDFQGYYNKEFGGLQSLAEKANPSINTSALNRFLRETVEKYRGIPTLHRDAKDIMQEIKNYGRNPPGDLKTTLKIFRSNNKKNTSIYEQRLLKGKRHEYVDFLNNVNRKIEESIGNTLPEDSAWFQKFKQMNREYAEYKAAQDTLRTLEPLMREKMSSSALNRIAEDPSKQKYLKLKMGEEGANEIIQLAKDLKLAKESIKKIKVKELNKFDAIWPISWVFKPLGIATTGKKAFDWGRRGYGYILSTPARRKAFDQALKAVAADDLSAYKEAVKALPNPNETKLLEYKPKS